MKKKIKKQEKPKTIKELAESFVESDGIPATAGKFLLMTLALGGIVFAGALAPGLLLASKEFSKSKKYNKKQIQNAVYNLKRRKLIEVVQMDDGKIKVKLTNKGRERIKEFSFETLKI
ncbi:MAG: hypothetical protein PHW24_04455 [Candidatus Moranbacteria bacterium]|nr:hypothetical protein [Candidatus Moranbacteria bacterium]